MWEINTYAMPCKNYMRITDNDALRFCRLLEKIKRYDKVFVPEEFYSINDRDGISAGDFLFNGHSDVNRLLLDTISKQKISPNTYVELFDQCILHEMAFALLRKDDGVDKVQEFCIHTYDDLVGLKRKFIRKSVNYKEYESKAIKCYENIVFHPDAFKRVEELGDIDKVIKELDRHLSALNDAAGRIYEEEKNEAAAISRFSSECGITCSGKGSNEKKDFKKEYMINTGSGSSNARKYTLNCNVHTKFYNGNNDQRIYFNWGRKEIENHKIIVVHIGGHWHG